ncbi:MAG: hypothetical protein AB7O44_01460 [Hyphomicrobiaceae bacterium]
MKIAGIILFIGKLALFAVSSLAPTSHAEAAKPFRPVVFIPGILGTQLLDDSGSVVWGGASSLSNFAKLEMNAGHSKVKLRPGRLIQEISILGPFWTIHQYDQLSKTFSDAGLVEGQSLYVFGYDWRLSNFENVKELKRLIQAHLKDRDFDIVAHSMGDIIARLFILSDSNAFRVKRLITLATPAQGSMNSIAELSEGWGGLENYIAGGLDLIRTVAFSFPSLFELFPSYDSCCRLGNERSYTAFDPTDYANWEKYGWVPVSHRVPDRIAAVKAALQSARRVRAQMAKRLPNSVELVMIAGDRIGTKYYWYVDPARPAVGNWRFSQSLGDGTVPLWSAAASNWPGKALPAFVDHATIFADPWVTNLLKRQLNSLGGPPPIANVTQTIAKANSGRLIEVSLIRADVDKMAASVGNAVNIEIVLTVVDSVSQGELAPIVQVTGPAGSSSRLGVAETTTTDDLTKRTHKYRGSVQIGEPGVYVVQVSLPGATGYYSRHIVAFGN